METNTPTMIPRLLLLSALLSLFKLDTAVVVPANFHETIMKKKNSYFKSFELNSPTCPSCSHSSCHSHSRGSRGPCGPRGPRSACSSSCC
jgi:hypothetical protein